MATQAQLANRYWRPNICPYSTWFPLRHVEVNSEASKIADPVCQPTPPSSIQGRSKLTPSLSRVRLHPSSWEELTLQCCSIYSKHRERQHGKVSFRVHDGPPYANGPLHCGHALNKILKDIIVRFQIQNGKLVTWRPGWDCHGLPIELKALGEESADRLKPKEIRSRAAGLAGSTVLSHVKQFKSFAISTDWEKRWTTMDAQYELKQLALLKTMVASGFVYRKHKPVYWSPVSRSALAESELEYNDKHVSQAVFIRYPIESSSCRNLPELSKLQDKLYAVIWTTTPWTLPANKAIGIHQDLEYSVLRVGQAAYLVASDCIPTVSPHLPEFTVEVSSLPGSRLLGLEYHNKMRGKEAPPQKIIHADFVTSESGTGLVHMAPGHGQADYEVCSRLGLDAFAPLEDDGRYTREAYPDDPMLLVSAPSVLDGGALAVLQIFGEDVLAEHAHQHRYPYDWRTKTPVIWRATSQWFADLSMLKEASLKALEGVRFIPEAGKSRLEAFIRSRSEWCISRQRFWGVPIPALYDAEGNAMMTPETIDHIIGVMKERGVNAWFSPVINDQVWTLPGLEGSWSRGTDTMDVWFDSGCSWMVTKGQADIYLEGSDQHRGWFQSSLLTFVAAQKAAGKKDSEIVAPFKTLMTHGFVLDDKGRKMSKSMGNVISPEDVLNTLLKEQRPHRNGVAPVVHKDAFGPDALRLWVATSDYTSDVRLGHAVMGPVSQTLVRYRNLLRMIVGLLQKPSKKMALPKIDQMALVQLHDTMEEVQKAFSNYEIHRAHRLINMWATRNLSAFYLEAIKDRIYCGDGHSALHYILMGFLRMLAPITPLLVEEVWSHRPLWMKGYKTKWRHPAEQYYLDPLTIREHFTIEPSELRWHTRILTVVHDTVKKLLEEAREKRMVGSALQCRVIVKTDDAKLLSIFKTHHDEMADFFVVSGVEINETVDQEAAWVFTSPLPLYGAPAPKGDVSIVPHKGTKCSRCWRYLVEDGGELCPRCVEVVRPFLEEEAKKKKTACAGQEAISEV